MPPSAQSRRGMHGDGEMETQQHGVRVSPAASAGVTAKMKARPAEEEPVAPRAATKSEKPAPRPRADHASGPVAVPVSVVTDDAGSQECDIRRLTRIIFSDIVIYGPEKADKAIRQGRFMESFKMELEEGRKIIRARFPADTASALAIFERCLEELLEARKKELASAIAL